MRRLLLGLAVLALALVLTGCPYNPEENGYTMVWSDEFDGAAIDTSVWELKNTPWEGPADSGEITVSDGTLKLRSYDDERDFQTAINTRGPRSSGEPNYPDHLSFEEGYFEARLRYTDDGYSLPAFWLFSTAVAEAQTVWPDPRDTGSHCPTLVSELDIMEGLVPTGAPGRPQSATGTLHRNTTIWADQLTCGQDDTAPANFRNAAEGEALHDWHVWAARWTADEVCWYLDREQYACQPTYDSTSQPMHIILSTAWYKEAPCRAWIFGESCPPRPDFTEMEVDYVRVWELTSP